MVSDADVAALYDVLNPWDTGEPEAAFVTALVLASPAVLDVGCGTGSLLHTARERGHTGRLTGLDPDPAMLDRARRRTDIEWVLARAADAAWDGEFDLATMTSNAWQCLITDDEVRASLAAIHRALVPGGRFVFGTRHPRAGEWRQWRPDAPFDVTFHGRALTMWYEVEHVDGDVVTLTETTAGPDRTVLRVDRAQLRFLDVGPLNGFLAEAGFEVREQWADWRRSPLDAAARQIVTVAGRV